MQAHDIKQLIAQSIDCHYLDIQGDDGVHFSAIIVADAFAGESRIERHQRVYAALGDAMGGDIHALSFKTYTPDEWAQLDPA